jgi:hypothetical protein
MNASELRIGNWVLPKFKEYKSEWKAKLDAIPEMVSQPIQVFPHLIARIFFDEDKTVTYDPIPLTEEWLLQFGFETNDVRYWQISSFRLHINRYGELIFKVVTFEQEIKYVHQLQNIYFDLVGEELTIKKINQITKCEKCGKCENIEEGECPYQLEINEEHVTCHCCEDCSRECCESI